MFGLSLGAFLAVSVASRDTRVDAVAELSGVIFDYLGGRLRGVPSASLATASSLHLDAGQRRGREGCASLILRNHPALLLQQQDRVALDRAGDRPRAERRKEIIAPGFQRDFAFGNEAVQAAGAFSGSALRRMRMRLLLPLP
jgi:hypothetical protein